MRFHLKILVFLCFGIHSIHAVEIASSGTCEEILQRIGKLRAIPQFLFPPGNFNRLKDLGVVAFHGNPATRILEHSLTTFSYNVPFEDGLCIWSEAPWNLKKKNRIKNYTKIQDPHYPETEHRDEWPTFKRAIRLAADYANFPDEIEIKDQRIAFDSGIILGLHSNIFDKYPVRFTSGPELDSSSGKNFAFPILSILSKKLPFDDVVALIFLGKPEQAGFSEFLRLKEKEVREIQLVKDPGDRSPSVDELFEIFKNRPGEFMSRIKDKNGKKSRDLLLAADESTKIKFAQTHPETWEYFLEIANQDHSSPSE